MMKIAYDHQIFSGQAYGGISRYFCEIAERIALFSGCEVKIFAPLHVNAFARDVVHAQLQGIRVPELPKTHRVRQRLNAALVKMLLRHDPPDVLHETCYAETTVAPKSSRIVVTVHDMINEKLPQLMSPQDKTSCWKAKAVQRSDHIICVSENTKKDLIEILGVYPSKISVVYHGCSLRATKGLQIKNVAGREPFLLYVGKRGGYKNFHRFLEAYGRSHHLKKDFKLICFGGPQFSASEAKNLRGFAIQAMVTRVVGDDSTLRDLYSSATCLVYPSLYEGFGIPVLEAMAYECPVACSRTSSLPEIAGDAAEYFDPVRPDSIRAAIEHVVYTDGRRSNLAEQGKRRAVQFSWDRCARQTLQVYSSLTKGISWHQYSTADSEHCSTIPFAFDRGR